MNSLIRKRLYSTATHTSIAPALHNIPQRWTKLKELEQADIVDYLAIKSQEPWINLTNNEKKAMYYISFGEWGPRAKVPPKTLSGALLKGLFSGVMFIAFGISLYNYAIDEEHKVREKKIEQIVAELKEKQAAELAEKQKKQYWLF